MTLDEAIKYAKEVAEKNQRVVDTGIVFDDVTIDMLYCDDTEVIEEHLANYQRCADEHRQLAEWLKDYKRLLEQPTSADCVSRAAVDHLCFEYLKPNTDDNIAFYEHFCDLPPVSPTQNWIPLVWDEYPTVDSDGNDDYVYAVDYSVTMPKEDEWVLVTDENHNVVKVQYDGYDFGDYARENILAWSPLPQPYEEK